MLESLYLATNTLLDKHFFGLFLVVFFSMMAFSVTLKQPALNFLCNGKIVAFSFFEGKKHLLKSCYYKGSPA